MSRHRRNHPGQRALICTLLTACAAAPPEERPATSAPAINETPIAKLYDDSGIPRSQPTEPSDRPPSPHPPIAPPQRVAGRFHLVVPEPLSQPIDLELVRVEPYDALVVLAEAHGLSVSYRRGVVIVGTPERAQP